MASWVAAGPAKKAAGSPGKARVRRKVTTRTPITLGIAEKIRLPIRPSIVALPPARYAMAALHLADAAEVELAVEPVGVAGDVLLHRSEERRVGKECVSPFRFRWSR